MSKDDRLHKAASTIAVDGSDAVFDQKIRNKMLVRILITAAAVLVALALVTFWITRSLLAAELKQKHESRVELVCSRIDRWLDKKGEVMRLLAARETKQPSSAEFKKEYFREIAARYGGVESAYIGYPDGSFVTGANWTPPPGYDPRKRPWYIAAVKAGGVTFSTPYRDALTKRLVTTVAIPMLRDGAVQAVLGMDIFIDDLVDAVHTLQTGRRDLAYVVDREGLYVAHPDPALILAKRVTGTSDERYFVRSAERMASAKERSAIFEGDDEFVLVGRIDAPRWLLFFHLPKSYVNRPLRRLALVFAAGILAALLVLALTVAYISERIAHPILTLADGAGGIADGEYHRRIAVSSRDEVGYLTKSFNDMAEGLAEREFIRSTFGRYVSEDVMKDILEGNLQLGGQTREVTILISDIRDFTRLSESMDAEELVARLNEYFTAMEGAIAAAGGSINKYLGDGILAMFGAPNRLDSHALAAVEAAYAMLNTELPALNERLGTGLAIGVGIHTGAAVVGNIGSEHRTEYTIIGDSVNSAARIESLSKRYREPLLISEATASRLPEDAWVLRTLDRVRVKGKSIPITLYAPHRRSDLDDADRSHIEASNRAVELYFAGEFAAAASAVADLPHRDRHLEMIAARCKSFIADPPESWDGVFTMKTK